LFTWCACHCSSLVQAVRQKKTNLPLSDRQKGTVLSLPKPDGPCPLPEIIRNRRPCRTILFTIRMSRPVALLTLLVSFVLWASAQETPAAPSAPVKAGAPDPLPSADPLPPDPA